MCRGRKPEEGGTHCRALTRLACLAGNAPPERFRGKAAARHGGAYRDRTDDLLNANQALSQLS